MSSSSTPLVLITGINGFIGQRVGLQVLEKGYRVRAAVRNKTKLATLLAGAYKPYADRIEIVEVPDITTNNAFDQAVIGAQHIVHLASPISFGLSTPQEFIEPAVSGAVNILKSAAKQQSLESDPKSSPLKSFVVTSSVVAVINPAKPADYVFTERDWNDFAEKEVAEKGAASPKAYWYFASKTAAERAVWNWVDDNKPSFSVTAINPSLVNGPLVALPDSPSGINESLRATWEILSGDAKAIPDPFGSGSCVDVRDVARVHIWAMEHPEVANGERYITAYGQGTPQAIADILHEGYPERKEKMVVGEPGQGYRKDYQYEIGGISGDKVEKATGQRWIRFDQSVLDAAKSLEGWLKK